MQDKRKIARQLEQKCKKLNQAFLSKDSYLSIKEPLKGPTHQITVEWPENGIESQAL
jgi:hypothetical protein